MPGSLTTFIENPPSFSFSDSTDILFKHDKFNKKQRQTYNPLVIELQYRYLETIESHILTLGSSITEKETSLNRLTFISHQFYELDWNHSKYASYRIESSLKSSR